MVEFANLTNIQLIAEGIECEEELKALLKLGVHNGQGYFLRRPDEELKEVEKEAVGIINKYSEKVFPRMTNNETKELRGVLFHFESYKDYAAYCEKYGDEEGDKLLGVMLQTVEQNLLESETAIKVNEDEILAVLEKDDYKYRSGKIVQMFKNQIQNFYSEIDRENGYIERINKRGEKKKCPLLALEFERVL